MSAAVIALASAAAAVYLLRPLLRDARGPREVGPREGTRAGRGRALLAVVVVLLAASSRPAAGADRDPFIGLLLLAVDVQRDYLRVSEALRIANPGAPRVLDLAVTLPPGARYLTAHRGLPHPVPTADGFTDRLLLARGVTEVVYSYALPSARELLLSRSFPLPAARLEIVVRGVGRRGLSASRGTALAPLAVGGEPLPRWEARDVRAGEVLAIRLRGLPLSRPWLPALAAALFAAVLAAGFAAAVRTAGTPRSGGVIVGVQNSQ